MLFHRRKTSDRTKTVGCTNLFKLLIHLFNLVVYPSRSLATQLVVFVTKKLIFSLLVHRIYVLIA